MTDSDDKLARRYRSLAREEPSAAVDAAILARARRQAGDGPRPAAGRPGFARWAGPVSIAAVLVLGIGVSLRMQMEKPGIETSAPASEYALPQSAEPAAPPASPPATPPASVPEAQPSRPAADANKAVQAPAVRQEAKERIAPPAKPATAAPPPPMQDRLDAAPKVEGNVAPAPATLGAPAIAPPAAKILAAPPAPAPAAAEIPRAAQPAPAEVGAAAGAAPQRAKRKAESDSSGAAELRKSIASDPERELERIAALREAGRDDEADRALEAFRKRHPDFRIPEAMWEKVRPR